MDYTKVNLRNLRELGSRLEGNLYYLDWDDNYWVVDDFSEEELRDMLRAKCLMIYIEGPARNPFNKEELNK